MIEVITYAECIIRLKSEQNYEQYVNDLLLNLQTDIKVEKIISVSKPEKNYKNGSLETNVFALFVLNIPESNSQKKVEEYVDHIVPFLKRHVPMCNNIISTKIVQMKRALEE